MKNSEDTLSEKSHSTSAHERVGSKQHNHAADLFQTSCEMACDAIAPAWPLDQSIAVNPHWFRIGRPVREVAARMAVLGKMHVFPPRIYIKEAWESGRIKPDSLRISLSELKSTISPMTTAESCIEALDRPIDFEKLQLPLLIDILDDDPARHRRLSWRDAITHQVSQTCAAYFDYCQADWQPSRNQGLFHFWRETIIDDHGIGNLMGLPKLSLHMHAIPKSRDDAEKWALQRLEIAHHALADYLEAILLTVNGWASWCAYLRWQAKLRGEHDETIRDLLAIRLAWGSLLLDCKSDGLAERAFSQLQADWQHAQQRFLLAGKILEIDEIWQRALEISYQRELTSQIRPRLKTSTEPSSPVPKPEVQALFCIDVRSEPIRKALERQSQALQTQGFAGFFGLPIAYTPLGTATRRPQLPGLLPAQFEVTDQIWAHSEAKNQDFDTSELALNRQKNFDHDRQWLATSRWPQSAFLFVEAMGFSYLGRLAHWIRPSDSRRTRDDLYAVPERYHATFRPVLLSDLENKTQLAARFLTATGLDASPATLVLIVGHASQTHNNAQASSLDCGACCGQSGEVNARVLAQLLNDPDVRASLRDRCIDIPEDTFFVPAVHNTTTEEIEAFDLEQLPSNLATQWKQLSTALLRAGDEVRRYRAPHVEIGRDLAVKKLLQAFRQRANDGAQTRPEWGLAGNAAFIIAPRSLTREIDLQGRSFLHDYDQGQDEDGKLLELLMTAPMLVTHWINWQYHASTCEPRRLGSGNKLLHNVVGGKIGVFEGNGGDLRIGLSTQSLHDGNRWIHEPVRLTVIIDAPQDRIEGIIRKHAVVRNLVENAWLHLWRIEADGLMRFEKGAWVAVAFDE